MSAWRRRALVALPEGRDWIERAHSPMALWIDLHNAFVAAFAAGDLATVDRIMAFARWCLDSPNGDVFTAVALAFFEHLPCDPKIREALPDLITREEFEGLRVVFAYHAGDEAVRSIGEAFCARGRRNRR